MSELNVTLPLWWVLGIIIMGLAGSYGFTWAVFNKWREGNKELWKAVTDIQKNDLLHIEQRLAKLEGK